MTNQHPITMTGKKLYTVRVEYKAYVLAESESEAKGFAREITETEDCPQIFVNEANGRNELGWPIGCYVYHDGPGDIRLGEVLVSPTP